MAYDIEGNGRDGEELQSKVFDGCFRLTVREQVRVDDAMVHASEVRGWVRNISTG